MIAPLKAIVPSLPPTPLKSGLVKTKMKDMSNPARIKPQAPKTVGSHIPRNDPQKIAVSLFLKIEAPINPIRALAKTVDI